MIREQFDYKQAGVNGAHGLLGLTLVVALGAGLAGCGQDRETQRAAPSAVQEPSGPDLVSPARAETFNRPEFSKVSQECIQCHQKESGGTVQQWGSSRHYRAKVGCYECHQAHPGDKDAIMHYNQRISVVVSPKDCGQCHPQEAAEFAASHHSQGQ